jgi:hypothetical protein
VQAFGFAWAMPAPLNTVGTFLGVDQRWDMFSTPALADDGWWVMAGNTSSGAAYDFFPGGTLEHGVWSRPLLYEKPRTLSANFKNHRWRYYARWLWTNGAWNNAYLAAFVCWNWNVNLAHAGADRLHTLELSYMIEPTPPVGQPQAEAVRRSVWLHWCYDVPTNLTAYAP